MRAAHPGAAIIGVGGVMCGEDAVELVMAGADAVQVGSATFRDPRAPLRVLREMEQWCSRRWVRRLADLKGRGPWVIRSPAEGLAATVTAAVARAGPLCAGIDPSGALLDRWGLPDSADGLRSFGLSCVEAFAGTVPVIKPQVAFFERWGSAGIGALESVIVAAREAGLLVIADAKRGDIGSTMEAYASAWLDPASPLAADAVTLVPYLGIGALRPAIDLAAASGRGAIVVVRSSNPEGRSIQEATTAAGPGHGPGGPSVEDALLGAIAISTGGAWPSPAPSVQWWGRPWSPQDSSWPGSGASSWLRVSARREGRPRARPDCSPGAHHTACWPTCPARCWPPGPTWPVSGRRPARHRTNCAVPSDEPGRRRRQRSAVGRSSVNWMKAAPGRYSHRDLVRSTVEVDVEDVGDAGGVGCAAQAHVGRGQERLPAVDRAR